MARVPSPSATTLSTAGVALGEAARVGDGGEDLVAWAADLDSVLEVGHAGACAGGGLAT